MQARAGAGRRSCRTLDARAAAARRASATQKGNDEFRDDFLQADAERAARGGHQAHASTAPRCSTAASTMRSASCIARWRGGVAVRRPSAGSPSASARQRDDACRRCAGWSPTRAGAEQAQAALRALAAHAERRRAPAYRAYQQRLSDYNCALRRAAAQRTTPEQRRHGARAPEGLGRRPAGAGGDSATADVSERRAARPALIASAATSAARAGRVTRMRHRAAPAGSPSARPRTSPPAARRRRACSRRCWRAPRTAAGRSLRSRISSADLAVVARRLAVVPCRVARSARIAVGPVEPGHGRP